MSISQIANSKEYYSRQLDIMKESLIRAKESNKYIDNLQLLYSKVEETYLRTTRYIHELNIILAAVISTEHDYQNMRITYLNSLITSALSDVFPNEGFKVNVVYDYNRKDTIKLELIDAYGNISSPLIGQGQLMQYVISFSAVVGIVKGLGFKNMFIDEAFGVAAVDKLHDLGEILNKHILDGIQIILVSQNPSLYSDIPNRKINLHKDPATGCTSVVSIEDS